jgi:undecaprenyl-diphosphatase
VNDWISAIVLGIIEGLTEFIPVSSTGHLLLAKAALGLAPRWDTFIVMIQLGAVLAVVALYFTRLWTMVVKLPTDPGARRFALSVIVAFLPAAVVGVLAHDLIKSLFSPMVVCWALVIGGIALLVLEKFAPQPTQSDAMNLPIMTALGIGAMQCLAMIPGVSRSGATIMGGLLMKCEKKVAAEFSFFLAIPTMAGAFALDFIESRDQLTSDFMGLIAVGFAVSFLVGLVVVRWMLDVVQRHGFAPFSWWRIVVGALGLVLMSTGVLHA